MAKEVGILTVARYLCEGVGEDIRCFVDTKYGMREVCCFEGTPGKMQALLKSRKRIWPCLYSKTNVRLDTEVFLAKRDLVGLSRTEILPIAERAASVDALIPLSQRLRLASTQPVDVAQQGTNAPKVIEDEALPVPTMVWQG